MSCPYPVVYATVVAGIVWKCLAIAFGTSVSVCEAWCEAAKRGVSLAARIIVSCIDIDQRVLDQGITPSQST